MNNIRGEEDEGKPGWYRLRAGYESVLGGVESNEGRWTLRICDSSPTVYTINLIGRILMKVEPTVSPILKTTLHLSLEFPGLYYSTTYL